MVQYIEKQTHSLTLLNYIIAKPLGEILTATLLRQRLSVYFSGSNQLQIIHIRP